MNRTAEEKAAALDVLRRARARIEDRAHWAQGGYAFDRAGNAVAPNNPQATRWDALGAIFAEGADGSAPVWRSADLTPAAFDAAAQLGYVAFELCGRHIAKVNDAALVAGPDFGHPAVLRCYDEAIRRLSGGA